MKLSEYPTDQIINELITKIKQTNGLDFCEYDKISELLDLLLNFLTEKDK